MEKPPSGYEPLAGAGSEFCYRREVERQELWIGDPTIISCRQKSDGPASEEQVSHTIREVQAISFSERKEEELQATVGYSGNSLQFRHTITSAVGISLTTGQEVTRSISEPRHNGFEVIVQPQELRDYYVVRIMKYERPRLLRGGGGWNDLAYMNGYKVVEFRWKRTKRYSPECSLLEDDRGPVTGFVDGYHNKIDGPLWYEVSDGGVPALVPLRTDETGRLIGPERYLSSTAGTAQ